MALPHDKGGGLLGFQERILAQATPTIIHYAGYSPVSNRLCQKLFEKKEKFRRVTNSAVYQWFKSATFFPSQLRVVRTSSRPVRASRNNSERSCGPV